MRSDHALFVRSVLLPSGLPSRGTNSLTRSFKGASAKTGDPEMVRTLSDARRFYVYIYIYIYVGSTLCHLLHEFGQWRRLLYQCQY